MTSLDENAKNPFASRPERHVAYRQKDCEFFHFCTFHRSFRAEASFVEKFEEAKSDDEADAIFSFARAL